MNDRHTSVSMGLPCLDRNYRDDILLTAGSSVPSCRNEGHWSVCVEGVNRFLIAPLATAAEPSILF